MNKFLLFFILFLPASTVLGQRKLNKEYKQNLYYYSQVFKEFDKEFEITKAPVEWKDEPYVVLCQKAYVSFHEYGKTGIARKRVLIQDASELETFTEFYYQNAAAFGLTHIKPDGRTIKIDTKNAIKVETKVPDYYRDDFHSEEYYKVSIPDLEVGDMLDYIKVFKESSNYGNQLIKGLEYSYPVLSQELIFDLHKSWTLYFDTFNGAAPIEKVTGDGRNDDGKLDDDFTRYSYKEMNSDAVERERWSLLVKHGPFLKMMAQKSTSDDTYRLEHEIDIRKTWKSAINWYQGGIELASRALHKSAKTAKIKKLPKEEQVIALYGLLRLYSTTDVMLTPGGTERTAFCDGMIEELSYKHYTLPSGPFSVLYADLLIAHDIDYEYVTVVPEYYGTPETAVMSQEFEYGVYVPLTKQCYWTVNNFRLAGEQPLKVLGAYGYKTDKSDINAGKGKLPRVRIPYSEYEKNVSNTVMDVTLNDDFSLGCKEILTHSGLYKQEYNQRFLFDTYYAEEDIMTLAKSSWRESWSAYKKDGIENKRLRFKSDKIKKHKEKKKELSKAKMKMIKNWLESDFEIDTLESFEVLNYGTYPAEPDMKVAIDFKASGLVKKAGKNLIFELGKLIGGQVALEDDEMENRKTDIYLDYSKSILNTISVTLPEGYTAHGLDAFAFNVDNEQAAFISSVVQDGNVLKMETKKLYKQGMSEAATWGNIVEALEAAYKFTQQKVVLKPAQ